MQIKLVSVVVRNDDKIRENFKLFRNFTGNFVVENSRSGEFVFFNL